MSGWIFTFTAVSVCVFVANLLLENTKFAPVAKKTLAIVLALVLSLPVFGLFNLNFDPNGFEKNGITVNNELFEELLEAKLNAVRKTIIAEFERNGLEGADVYFITDDNGETITKILVDVSNAEYNDGAANINEISKYVNNVFHTDAEIVLYD